MAVTLSFAEYEFLRDLASIAAGDQRSASSYIKEIDNAVRNAK